MSNMSSDDVRNEIIYLLDKLKFLFPDTVITMETPGNTVSCRVGDALIYDGMDGSIVIDTE